MTRHPIRDRLLEIAHEIKPLSTYRAAELAAMAVEIGRLEITLDEIIEEDREEQRLLEAREAAKTAAVRRDLAIRAAGNVVDMQRAFGMPFLVGKAGL